MSRLIGWGRYKSETYPVSSRGAGSPSSSSVRVVWYPLGGGDATTWQEVVALINGRAEIEILVGQVGATYTIPAGTGPWEVNGASIVAPATVDTILTLITGADGAQISNLRGISNVALQSITTSLPLLIWDAYAAWFYMLGFEQILKSSGSAPMIALGDAPGLTSGLVISAENESVLQNDGAVVVDIIAAFAGPELVLAVRDLIGDFLSVNAVSGNAASTLNFLQDGSAPVPLPAQGGFLGTIQNAAYGTVGGSGASNFRPTPAGVNVLKDGTIYYDAENHRELIFSNGLWCVLSQTFRGTGAGGVIGTNTVVASIAGVVLEPGGWARINAQVLFAVTVADTDVAIAVVVTRTSPPAAPVAYAVAIDSVLVGKSGTVALNTAIQIGGGLGPGTFTFELQATKTGGTATIPAQSGQVFGADLVLALSP